MTKFLKLSILLLVVLLCSYQPIFAQIGYTIDHVDGAYNNDIKPGVPVRLYLKLYNYSEERVACITTGFRIYLSNNGVIPNGEFQVVDYNQMLINWDLKFDLVHSFNTFSFDGIGADTIGIGGVFLTWNDDRGFDPGFDSVITVFTTQVDESFAGDSLCIDSAYYPPTGSWLWLMRDNTTGGFNNRYPDWSGPHCYEILPSCCIGISGNVDNDSIEQISVSDLNVLVQYMFLGGPQPLCFDEADINNDGQLHIQDIVDMVAYMFQGGQAPATCP